MRRVVVRHSVRLSAAFIALLLLAFAPAAFAQLATPPATPVSPVSDPCPRFAAGSVIHQPDALFSQNGMLAVRFSYQTTTDSVGRTLYCFMTPDGIENPTLHVKPGDHLVITLTNNVPAQPLTMMINSPNCGANMMGNSSVNIHYHGTNTAPNCHQDEVIKTIVNSGDTFQYNVAFPSDEPPGLYWYHPHIHGIAEAALLGGAAGAIVVDGIQNVQPAVAGLRHRILIVRDQPQVQGLDEGGGGCVNDVPFQDITINNIPVDSNQQTPGGPVTFTPAILKMTDGQKEFWRLTNSSSDTILDLQLVFDGKPQSFDIVAIDGVPVNSQDGEQPGGLISTKNFRIPPASRLEFLVNPPSSNVKLAQLITTSIQTGGDGDCDPTRPIFTIRLNKDKDSETASNDDYVGPFTGLSTSSRRFAGLGTAPVARKRLVYFDEIQPTTFFMVVNGQPEKVFDPNAPPAITAVQGTVEEWTVENHAQENHEFHFHQLHFMVESQDHFKVNGMPEAPGVVGQYLDMIEVPGWDGNPDHPFPSVKLLIDFRGKDVGIFVFHCHILGHEDLGMMNIIQVVKPEDAKPFPTTVEAAPAAGTYGGTTNLTATLTSGGDPLGNKTISFSLNGTPVGSATTDKNGIATLSGASLAGINAGVYSSGVLATFAGDGNYVAGSAVNSLSVAPLDVSSLIGVTRGGYALNIVTGRYSQTVKLTNNSGSTIAGPISLVVDGLSANATVFNAAGSTDSLALPVSPYVSSGGLAPGQSVSVVLQFSNPTKAGITYNTRLLAGPGSR